MPQHIENGVIWAIFRDTSPKTFGFANGAGNARELWKTHAPNGYGRGSRDKEVEMKSNRLLRLLMVVGAFWLMFSYFSPL
jgi:hypothetical protein